MADLAFLTCAGRDITVGYQVVLQQDAVGQKE